MSRGASLIREWSFHGSYPSTGASDSRCPPVHRPNTSCRMGLTRPGVASPSARMAAPFRTPLRIGRTFPPTCFRTPRPSPHVIRPRSRWISSFRVMIAFRSLISTLAGINGERARISSLIPIELSLAALAPRLPRVSPARATSSSPRPMAAYAISGARCRRSAGVTRGRFGKWMQGPAEPMVWADFAVPTRACSSQSRPGAMPLQSTSTRLVPCDRESSRSSTPPRAPPSIPTGSTAILSRRSRTILAGTRT